MAVNWKHAGFLLTGIMIGALSAQTLPAKSENIRTELFKNDLSGAGGTEVIMATLEIQPGDTVPRHFHYGDEYLYVLEGGQLQPRGQDPVTFKAGMALHFSREEPHGGFTVIGDKSIKVLTIHIVDKDKPLVELVK